MNSSVSRHRDEVLVVQMKFSLASYLRFFFLWHCGPERTVLRTLPELVRRIKPSAVAIETFDARGEKLSRGSGFFIDTDRVVTNRHVIDNAYRAEVHSYNGSVYPVKGVIAVDAEGDLALLRVDAPPNQVRPPLARPNFAAGRRERSCNRKSIWT